MISTIFCRFRTGSDRFVSILYLPRLWFLLGYVSYGYPRYYTVSILYLPRLWFLLQANGSEGTVEISVSILYLPRLWFLLKKVGVDPMDPTASQSSIYRGYDFYWTRAGSRGAKSGCLNPLSIEVMISTPWGNLGEVASCFGLNPLSTEVMISTWKSSNSTQSALESQSSIYRGYDFY